MALAHSHPLTTAWHRSRSRTHSHSRSRSASHSLGLAYTLTHSVKTSPMRSLTHSLPPRVVSLANGRTHALTRSLTNSRTHPLIHAPTHSLTLSLSLSQAKSHSLTNQRTHSLNQSINRDSNSLTDGRHSLPHSVALLRVTAHRRGQQAATIPVSRIVPRIFFWHAFSHASSLCAHSIRLTTYASTKSNRR